MQYVEKRVSLFYTMHQYIVTNLHINVFLKQHVMKKTKHNNGNSNWQYFHKNMISWEY